MIIIDKDRANDDHIMTQTSYDHCCCFQYVVTVNLRKKIDHMQ